jgi:choline dehydrogenase
VDGQCSLGTVNYLKDPEDMEALIAAVERGREIFASAPLRGLVGREIHPGGEISSRQALDKVIRREVEHTYHPACTARTVAESRTPDIGRSFMQGLGGI